MLRNIGHFLMFIKLIYFEHQSVNRMTNGQTEVNITHFHNRKKVQQG